MSLPQMQNIDFAVSGADSFFTEGVQLMYLFFRLDRAHHMYYGFLIIVLYRTEFCEALSATQHLFWA